MPALALRQRPHRPDERGRGALRWLIVLGLLVALVVVGDVVVKGYAEDELEQRLAAQFPGSSSVQADIDSFPFLVRLGASGSVPRVRARVDRLAVGPVVLGDARVELDGVRLDRGALLRRQVQLTDVDRGEGTVNLEEQALSDSLGLPTTIQPDGQVRVQAGTRRVVVPVKVGPGGLVTIDPPGPFPGIALQEGQLPFLPCTPRATPSAGRLQLSCSLTEVPPELLEEANRRART